jgi:hypothetical protein
MIEVLKQMVEALENDHIFEWPAMNRPKKVEEKRQEAIAALKKQLADHAMREVQRLGQEIEQEPICPDCKAEVLYECVACSSNNYPPQRTEPVSDDIASILACRDMLDAQPVPPKVNT